MERLMGLNRHRFIRLYWLGLLVWTAVVSLPLRAQESTPEAVSTYPNADLLVSVDWLNDHLTDDSVRVIDMRAPDAYADAHVPGAVNIPVSAISSTLDDISMEFDGDEVQAALNAAGLTPDMTAVIYDNLGMMDSARLFWTLEYVGHADVRVVNGGWDAWIEAGYETTTDVPDIQPTEYPITLQPERLISADEVLSVLEDPAYVIVDARSPQEYTGEATFSRRAGHIPGAVLLTWVDTLTGGDAVDAIERDWQEQLRDEDLELFKSADELEALLTERGITPDRTIITYCQTFWRGAHVYFLLRLMDYEDVRGYDGSWSEWGNRDDLPIVTGDAP